MQRNAVWVMTSMTSLAVLTGCGLGAEEDEGWRIWSREVGTMPGCAAKAATPSAAHRLPASAACSTFESFETP